VSPISITVAFAVPIHNIKNIPIKNPTNCFIKISFCFQGNRLFFFRTLWFSVPAFGLVWLFLDMLKFFWKFQY
jgi:hypothetical protein